MPVLQVQNLPTKNAVALWRAWSFSSPLRVGRYSLSQNTPYGVRNGVAKHCGRVISPKPVWPVCVSIYDFVGLVVSGGDEWFKVGEQGAGYKICICLLESCRLTSC